MIDYLIELISEYDSDIEKMMNLEPNNNQNVFELLPLLRNDSVFDEEKINSLLSSSTILYKLSYKSIDDNSKGVRLLQEKIGDFNV